MSLPLFVALVLSQNAQQTPPVQTGTPTTAPPPLVASAVVAPVAYSFASPQPVADVRRLELTPKLDGKIGDEEWDPFSSVDQGKSYLQWEPGVVYAAATGPVGADLVVSLDLDGDGWLVGHDNIEARVSLASGKPVITVRELDATNVAGPVWRDLPGFVMASEAAAAVDGNTVTYELKLADPGVGFLPESNSKLNARVDLVPTADAPPVAFAPRVLTPVQLVATRSAALPMGLNWNIEHNERAVTPGDNAFMRLTFNTKTPVAPKKINLHSEGLAKDATNDVTMPFPPFDPKGRSFVDYSSKIDSAADLGYRVVRGTMTLPDGTPAVVEASYRIAPVMDFDLVHETLKASPHDRDVKMAFYLSSNSPAPVGGHITVTVPQGFRVLNGQDEQKFVIEDRRGKVRKSFDLYVPANVIGTFPIVFRTVANGKKIENTSFITIG